MLNEQQLKIIKLLSVEIAGALNAKAIAEALPDSNPDRMDAKVRHFTRKAQQLRAARESLEDIFAAQIQEYC